MDEHETTNTDTTDEKALFNNIIDTNKEQSELYNRYVTQINHINERIDHLETQTPDSDQYKKQRMDIINQLDFVEENIMKHDWDLSKFNYRLLLRPKLYNLYQRIKYCAPNRTIRQYKRKKDE